jgi:putative transposase
MPRHRRIIFPGVPYHVTQRGNYREQVFLSRGDPEAYLGLLHAYAKRFGVLIFAYCLMPNHVHLIVIPQNNDGMPRALRAVHCQYAQRIHRMRAVTGHLWQGRYNSCALDSAHFLNAIRYVELNPVRPGRVARPEDYPWSSAAAHCGLRLDPMLEPAQSSALLRGIKDWSGWLAQGVPQDCLTRLRRNVPGNLPCGSDEFVTTLEKSTGRCLRHRTRGGQKKS